MQKLRSTNLNNITIDSKNLQNIFNELFIFSDDACIELKDKSILFYTTNDTISTKYDITIDKMEEKEGWAISEVRLPISGENGSSTTVFHSIFRPGSTHAKHLHTIFRAT